MQRFIKICIIAIAILTIINISLLFHCSNVFAEELTIDEPMLMSAMSTVSIDGSYEFEKLLIKGKTTVVGNGTVSPDNIFSYIGVVNPVLNVADGSDTSNYIIPTNSPLYRISDDLYDKYDILNGIELHNVGVKVFDGSELWVEGGDNPQQPYNRFETALPEKSTLAGSYVTNTLLCTHFTQIGYLGSSVYPAIADRPGGGISIRVNKSIPDAAAFRAWLAEQYAAGTPVTVYYKLASSVSYNHSLLNIKPYSDYSNVTISSGILDYAIKFVKNNVLTVLRSIDSHLANMESGNVETNTFLNVFVWFIFVFIAFFLGWKIYKHLIYKWLRGYKFL